ncbi:MAG: BrnT family toxin [Acidobacteriaceae bacterium]
MVGMVLFERDESKAKSNKRKHGVSFEVAAMVFDGPYAVAERDRMEDGEYRWQTIGMVEGVVLLLVGHTVREEGQDEIIRIITARKAARRERIRYDENRKKDPC